MAKQRMVWKDQSPDGGQSSHHTWKKSQPRSKWKEISAKIDAVGTAVKEKANTWNKSCEESVKNGSHGRKTRTKKKRNDQGSAGAAPKEKGRGG